MLRLAAVSTLLLALIPSPGRTDVDIQRQSLQGLRGIGVKVSVDDDMTTYALPSDLQTGIELRLRNAGVAIYTDDELAKDPRGPFLAIDVIGIPADDEKHAYAIAVTMTLTQWLWRVGNGKLLAVLPATTWSSSRLLVYGTTTLKEGKLDAALGKMTDGFINAWMASHASKPGAATEPRER